MDSRVFVGMSIRTMPQCGMAPKDCHRRALLCPDHLHRQLAYPSVLEMLGCHGFSTYYLRIASICMTLSWQGKPMIDQATRAAIPHPDHALHSARLHLQIKLLAFE